MPTRITTAVMDKDTSRSAVADDFLHAAPARAANRLAAPAYTAPARALHWITAALILFMIPTGFMAANEWGGSLQDSLYDLHKSIGALILPIVTVRLLYRWRASASAAACRCSAVATAGGRGDALGALRFARAAAADRVGRHIRLSGPCARVRVGDAAADLACESRALGAAVLGSSTGRHRHRLPGHRAYRWGALSSFCAQGPRAHAYDQRLKGRRPGVCLAAAGPNAPAALPLLQAPAQPAIPAGGRRLV